MSARVTAGVMLMLLGKVVRLVVAGRQGTTLQGYELGAIHYRPCSATWWAHIAASLVGAAVCAYLLATGALPGA